MPAGEIPFVLVGSLPASLRANQHCLRLCSQFTPRTRLQWTDKSSSLLDDFCALASGAIASDGPATAAALPPANSTANSAHQARYDACVTKAQICGPLTWASYAADSHNAKLRAGLSTRQPAQAPQAGAAALWFDALPHVLKTLRTAHPALAELWLDEPALHTAQSDDLHALTNNALAQLRVIAPEFRVGLHCCGKTNWLNFAAFDGWNFDAFLHADAVLLAAAQLGAQCPELVPGIFPAFPISDDAARAQLENFDSKFTGEFGLSPVNRPVRWSASCGLGAHTEEDALALLEQSLRVLAPRLSINDFSSRTAP